MTDINLFKKTLDSAYPVKTPTQEKYFSELETKQKMNEYKSMLAPQKTLSDEQLLAQEGVQLEQANYNVGELFSQTSSGEYVAKFPTYTPGRDNYDYFSRNQTTGDKWFNGVKQFGQTIVNSVAGLGNLVYGTGAMIAEGELSAFYDNDYMNWLDDVSEMRRLENPIYKTYEEQEMGFGESLGTASFWADDFLQGTAFTAGMIASEAVLRGLTGGLVGGVGFARTSLGTMSKARAVATSPITKAMSNTLKNINNVKIMDAIGKGSNIARTMITSAAYEAGFEARHFMREMRDSFEQDFLEKNGTLPTEQDKANFEEKLKSQANELFGFNLAVVGASNIAQFGGVLGIKRPKISPDNWFNSKLFGAGIKDGVAITATKGQLVNRALYTLGKNAFLEGVVEEGLQAVGSRTSETLLKSTYDKTNTEKSIGYAEAFLSGLEETYGTEEGRKEVYLGMLIGALTGSATNMFQARSLNPSDTSFKWLDERAKGLENELMKGTYSAKVLAENLFATNRTIAFKTQEEEANKKGDFLGGQQARAGSIFSQALRGVNLEYTDKIKEQTLQAFDTATDQEIVEKAGVDVSMASELREQMKQEYTEQFDKAVKYQETANALIGDKLTKGEMQEFEKVVDEYVAKGYAPETAKAEAVSVLRSALGFELFMGDVAYNHSEEMKNAFLNELGNSLVTENIRKALDIHDVLKKAGKSKQLEFGRVRKEIVKTKDEISKLEKEYKTVENLIAQATAETTNRAELIGKLNDLTNRKNELTNRQIELEAQANTLLKSSVIQNRFGASVSAPFVTADEIETLEKEISNAMETLDALLGEKGLKAKKFLQEYEKSVEAFKRYDQRVNQLLDPKVGLRGKKGILPSFFSAKTPAEQTADMIRGILNTHFIQQAERARLAKEVKNDLENQVQTNTEDIKNYLEDQPYLFEQYGGSLDNVLPTKEEVQEFYNLALRQDELSAEEKTRLEELTNKLANWSLTESTSLKDIVLQEALRKTEVEEKPIEDLTEEDVNTMVDEEKEKRPFNFLQTVSHVYVKHFPDSATYVFSHITPKGFLEMLGQTTGLTAYDKETDKVSDITIDDVNDLKQGTIVSFGNNFSFKIGDGRNVVLYASKENFNSLGIKFRATPSNYSVVLGADGKPMPTDFEDAITYSFDEAMNLESGSVLIAKVDMDDPYNKSLSDEEFENSVRITFYDENGNKVSMLKGTREGETEIAPENYLKLRASAVKNAKGKEGLIELGEANIETIFIGAPIVEGEFAIDENLIETTGSWDGNKLTLDTELKGVRVDLLKGLDKSLPVVVVKKGTTLIAYPVKGGRVDSNQADSFTETGAELAIKINQTLIDNNLSPEPIYFNSVEDNNMYNADGSKTEALLSAIEKVNKIPAKEFDLTSATINIDLEGQRFLPPKISIDLDSLTLYDEPTPQRLLLGQGAIEDIVSEEVVVEPQEGDLFTLNYSEGDSRDIEFRNGKFGSEISGKFVAEYDKNQPYYRWLFDLASKNGGVVEEYDHKEFKEIFTTATENFRDKESKEELNKKC